MNEGEFIDALKEFCKQHDFEYRGRIQFANNQLLIFIFGENCIEPFDIWLNAWTQKHSTPTIFEDAIGSYITLLE